MPHHAELALAVVVCALVLTVDLRGAIGFSPFGALLYYLVASLSASAQDSDHRRFLRALQIVSAAGCAVLAATLPLTWSWRDSPCSLWASPTVCCGCGRRSAQADCLGPGSAGRQRTDSRLDE